MVESSVSAAEIQNAPVGPIAIPHALTSIGSIMFGMYSGASDTRFVTWYTEEIVLFSSPISSPEELGDTISSFAQPRPSKRVENKIRNRPLQDLPEFGVRC